MYNRQKQKHNDLEVKVSWSQIKVSKIGMEWEASLGYNTETAVVLFINEKGDFSRFLHQYHPDNLAEYQEEIGLEYFHFFIILFSFLELYLDF